MRELSAAGVRACQRQVVPEAIVSCVCVCVCVPWCRAVALATEQDQALYRKYGSQLPSNLSPRSSSIEEGASAAYLREAAAMAAAISNSTSSNGVDRHWTKEPGRVDVFAMEE